MERSGLQALVGRISGCMAEEAHVVSRHAEGPGRSSNHVECAAEREGCNQGWKLYRDIFLTGDVLLLYMKLA